MPGYLTFWAFVLFTIANIVVEADGTPSPRPRHLALGTPRPLPDLGPLQLP